MQFDIFWKTVLFIDEKKWIFIKDIILKDILGDDFFCYKRCSEKKNIYLTFGISVLSFIFFKSSFLKGD